MSGSGSVTRDVVIKLNIQVGKFTPPTQAMESSMRDAGAKAGAAWLDAAKRETDKFTPHPGERAAVNPVAAAVAEVAVEKFTPPSTQKLEASMADSGTKAGKAWKSNFRAMVQEAASEGKINAPMEIIRNPQAMQSAADAFKKAGEGAFLMARGIAFMTATSEADLAVTVKRIAAVQGLFDIYRGGVDLIDGVAKGTKMLALVNASASAAEAIHAGTMSKSAIAMMGLKNGGAALATALTGPVGIGLAAVALAASAGYVIWRDYQNQLDEVARRSAKVVDANDILYRSQVRLADIERVRNNLSRQSAVSSELSKLMLDTKNADSLERMAKSRMDSQEARARSLLAVFRIGDAARLGRRMDDSGIAGLPDARSQQQIIQDQTKFFARIRKASDNAGGALKPLQASDFSHLSRLDGEVGSQNRLEQAKALELMAAKDKANLSERKEVQQSLVEIAEEQKQQIADRLGLLGQERTALLTNLQAERDRSKAIKEQKTADAQSRMTVEEKFGRLDIWKQRQVKDIGQQVQDKGFGSLQKHQRDVLDETGLAQAMSSRFYIDEGKKALGPDKKLFDQLKTFGTTPQEAAAGGIEGEDRGNMLDFKQQASNANANAIKQAMKENDKLRKDEDAAMQDAIESLKNGHSKIEDLGKEITDRDRVVEQVLKQVQESKRNIQAIADGILHSHMARAQ
ncbi:MAG: hypothetical protein JWN70_6384 [Planctomycetaceae bacterium]|nr:hypothetical protein [Planctomycetaceae bacterium]